MIYKKYLLFLIVLLCACLKSNAQLSAGDIAIVQYNADGTDDFSFVALTDIAVGEVIHFTDNEEDTLTGGEGTISWTSPTGGISCGTIITITTTPSASAGNVTETNDLNFNGDGDSLLAYQGTTATPTYLAALDNDGAAPDTWGSAAAGNLPAGLTDGLNAVSLSEIDNTAYTGTFSGTTAAILASINNSGNWTGSNTVNQTVGGPFTISDCGGCTPTHTITGFSPISGPGLTQVTITGSGFTATSTVDFNGTAGTVTFVDSTTLIAEVPVGASTGTITVTESACGLDSATSFLFLDDDCGSGGISASFTDLLISGVYDDQTDSCHYIELLNPTATDIDLSTYTLGIDNNFTLGSAVPTTGFNLSMALTGTISAGSTTMIILSSGASCSSCATITPDLSFSGGGLNDEDRVVLVNGSTAHDVWQNHTTPGVGFNLGYVFTRANTATAPSTTFALADWSFDGDEDCFGFAITSTPSPTIDTQPLDVDNCNSFSTSISATAGNAGALSYQWKYNDGTSTGWLDVTAAAFSPSIVVGETTTSLSIDGYNLDGYQFYCEVTETGLCAIASNAAQVTMQNTVWNGTTWSNGAPNLTTLAEIDGDYNTSTNGDFSACSLIINSSYTVTVTNNNFIEVENNVTNSGTLTVETSGAFVQNNDSATFTNSTGASSTVTKITAPAQDWLEYTFWSSPVIGETVGGALSPAAASRRFRFQAENFRDSAAEMNNDNVLVNGVYDDEDDNGNDWLWLAGSEILQPGIGYAATLSITSFAGSGVTHTFSGAFNNGVTPVTIYRNDTETNDKNWNFIGNPYPSAISVADFLSENSYDASTNPTGTLEGALYLWSHQNAPADNNNGNSQNNFSQSDYAMVNGTGGTAGGDNNGDGIVDALDEPNPYIPSGQGFFAEYHNMGSSTGSSTNGDGDTISEGTVTFNNSMRTTGNNNQFFRTSNQTNEANKLWLYLSSDTGVSSQILVGYLDGATNLYDGAFYDATRNRSVGNKTFLYSIIENNTLNYAIQGKAIESLTLDEVIPLGLYTTITNPVIYTISISHFEGEFFNTNTIYLKDNYNNVVHDLSNSNYDFASNDGEFRDRFEIVFKNNNLSIDGYDISVNDISIIELQNDNVKFTVPNSVTIQKVKIFDILGRELYQLYGSASTEIYNLPNLSSATYIAQISLSNGKIITKKMVKK
ncbi:T9SS type A sorting domain-containing protein [uncultured Lacinutrix sp.]|uniref:T9SS type A sorting domain-containing protein n=1 Tax=uncultured Lacinutrix sp. TaxID=574032 RepID=UPI00261800DE|nr:T9SS type A sorting domain-containing protein [uncultured Lacinutrix sp.]